MNDRKDSDVEPETLDGDNPLFPEYLDLPNLEDRLLQTFGQ